LHRQVQQRSIGDRNGPSHEKGAGSTLAHDRPDGVLAKFEGDDLFAAAGVAVGHQYYRLTPARRPDALLAVASDHAQRRCDRIEEFQELRWTPAPAVAQIENQRLGGGKALVHDSLKELERLRACARIDGRIGDAPAEARDDLARVVL